MDFWTEIPSLGKRDLRDLKKGIDGAFKNFSRTYGDGIEAFFDPLYFFLVRLEKLLIAAPWPIILILVGGLAYLGSRSIKLAIGSMLSGLKSKKPKDLINERRKKFLKLGSKGLAA